MPTFIQLGAQRLKLGCRAYDGTAVAFLKTSARAVVLSCAADTQHVGFSSETESSLQRARLKAYNLVI